ncbi:MAG TPA: tetratricopeptide repeat protein, partial [Treponema sp.]|nr:tetratricopeptide repeat protein [Treponema sp.]
MPSLQDLQEFKASLKEIGREPFVLSESGEPYEDLPLPDTEPVPLEPGESDDTVSSVSAAEAQLPSLSQDVFSLPLDSMEEGRTSGPESSDEIDFTSFLDAVTEAAFAEPEASETQTEAEAGEAGIEESSPEPEDMNFAVPDDLLQGFSDEIEASRSEEPGSEAPISEEAHVEDFSLDESAFPAETSPEIEQPIPEELINEESPEVPESDIIDLENLGGEELGFEEAPAVQEEPKEPITASSETPPVAGEEESFDFSIPEFEGSFPESGPSAPVSSTPADTLGSAFNEFEEFSL